VKPSAKFLEDSFRGYFETMDQCVTGRAYWALLHVLVVIPDVCAAMERKDGDADDGAYRNWCKRFLADKTMNAGDWYRLRCLLLHQGRTRDDERRSQYEEFQFSHPRADETSPLHRHTVGNGRTIHLDIQTLGCEVRCAMRKWFAWVERDAREEDVQYVARNANELAHKSVILLAATDAVSIHGQDATISVTSRPSQ
jgi:hypothetical protein